MLAAHKGTCSPESSSDVAPSQTATASVLVGASLVVASALATASLVVASLLATASLVAVLAPSTAHAQRGAAYTLDGNPPETPSSGFPGMFDANVAAKGSFVLDLPSLSADYGLTENVTIGTNGFFLGALALGVPAVYVKARYRFLSSEKLASAFTTYTGYLTNRVGSGAGDAIFDGYLLAASNNTTWYFSDRHTLNGFFYAIKLGQNARASDGLEYQNFSLATVLVGASYQYWVTRWFGPQALLAVSAYNNIGIDSSTLAANATLGAGGVGGVGAGFTFLRALAEFRLGRWLLSPGLIYFVGLGSDENGDAQGATLPWMSGTVKW
jgi:hypothetical protein